MRYLTQIMLLATVLTVPSATAQDVEAHRRLEQNPGGVKSDLQMRLELLQRLQRLARHGNLDLKKLSKEAREKLEQVQQQDKKLREQLRQRQQQQSNPPSETGRQQSPQPSDQRSRDDGEPQDPDQQQPRSRDLSRNQRPQGDRRIDRGSRDLRSSDPDPQRRSDTRQQPGDPPRERSENSNRIDGGDVNEIFEQMQRRIRQQRELQPGSRGDRQPGEPRSPQRETPSDRELGPMGGLDLERYMKQMKEFQRSDRPRDSANRNSRASRTPRDQGPATSPNRPATPSARNPSSNRPESWRDIVRQLERKSRQKKAPSERSSTKSDSRRIESPDIRRRSSDDKPEVDRTKAPAAPESSSKRGADSSPAADTSSPLKSSEPFGGSFLKDSFRRALNGSIDEIMDDYRKGGPSSSSLRRPPRAPNSGIFRDVGRRTSEFFGGDSPSVPSFNSGGRSFSAPSAPSAWALLPFAIGIALLGLGWFALKWFAAEPEPALAFANAAPAQLPAEIKSRQDVVNAFHFIAAESPAVKGNWWTHSRAGRALRKLMPAKDDAVSRLMTVYETARYLPPDEELTAAQLQTAREAIDRCKP